MPTFLLIGNKSCIKCQNTKDFMEKNNIKYEYKDESQELINEFKFASIPTLIVFDEKGEEIDRAVNKEASLIAKLNQYK